MILKLNSLLVLLGLADYATAFWSNFNYRVECAYLVQAYDYRHKFIETWHTTSSSRQTYESLDVSVSGRMKYGAISGSMATAMSQVRSATTKSHHAASSTSSHTEKFSAGTNQIHRKCDHTLNVGGQIVSYSQQIYLYTERTQFHTLDYWTAEARKYINENIIKHMYNVPYLTSGQSLVINYGIDVPANKGWHIQHEITVADGFWGNWGPMHMCPPNHYAVAGRARDEVNQGGGDDTCLNGYQMQCVEVKGKHNGQSIIGHVPHYRTEYGNFGDWTTFKRCEQGSFIAGHKIRMEPPQGDGDDTAANGIAMACRWSVHTDNQGSTPNTYPAQWTHGWTRNTVDHHMIIDQHHWGHFSHWVVCPARTYMCGFSLRIEPGQGGGLPPRGGDDTSMNGMRMTCCRMPWDEAP